MPEKFGNEIDTIIWDLDGTLLDSFGIYSELVTEVLPGFRLQVPTQAMMRRNYHGTLGDSINAALGNVLTPGDVEKVVAQFLVNQERHYETIEGHLFDDAEGLAMRAHAAGKRQILVTNRDHANRPNASPRSIVANSNLSRYITDVVCGDDSEHRKPKAEVLGPLLERHVPERTLVVGDQFVDAHFAYNLGSHAVLVSRTGEEPHHLDTLAHDWRTHVTIVDSLDRIEV